MNVEDIEKICGKFPENFVKEDILSNPNFVFINDTSYSAVQLWDVDGNTVNVNSFQECEHYVTGGWYYSQATVLETTFHLYLGVVIIFFIALTFIKKIFFLRKND